MGKRYYWLKLKEDFFDSKRIKKLRRLAGGDTFTIIYLKMQLKALKTDGVIKFDGLEKTFAEELALDIDEEPDNVQVTISYLISCGLIETSDDISYFLPYSVENTGSEGSSAKRMRELRERAADGKPEKPRHNKELPASQSDGEIEKEIEKEIEIEKDIEIDPKEEPASAAPRYDYEFFKTTYNSFCTKLPSCRTLTEKRKKAIRAYLKDFSTDQWKEICKLANQSEFLAGMNDRGWKADIEFLLRTDKAARVLEGGYQSNRRQQGSSNPFLDLLHEEGMA